MNPRFSISLLIHIAGNFHFPVPTPKFPEGLQKYSVFKAQAGCILKFSLFSGNSAPRLVSRQKAHPEGA
jgi:hypothetical protein